MKTFATASPISTVLDIPAGRIQLIAADRAETIVEVRPVDASKARDVRAAQETTVEYEEGALRITVPAKHQILGASGAVEVNVRVPAGSSVTATASATDLRGVGRLGAVTFHAAQSEIKLDEAAGVRLATQAGSVSVGRLSGDAQISTKHGGIRIGEAVSGHHELRTEDGDISVTAAAGASASLDAGTTAGRIQNALAGSGGNPDLQIRATTIRGDIHARSL